MTDRNARDTMAAALRSYMGEQITAFQFDDALGKVRTGDTTARRIRYLLWFHYDDCKDHKIVASKEQWDYFNRLLLLLASDAEIEVAKTWHRWRISQAAAALCLAGFAWVVIRTGFDIQLLACALPFGAVSLAIGWFNSQQRKARIPSRNDAIVPFPSIGSLRQVRRRVPGFVRTRYPAALAGRRIRSAIDSKLLHIPWMMLWLVFGPIGLLIQALPQREGTTRILVSEP